MKKYLRLNKSATDSYTQGYFILPVSSFRGAHPSSDTALELYFEPAIKSKYTTGNTNLKVTLTVGTNKHKDVLQVLTREFSTGEDVYIDIDEETSTFPTSDITAVVWAFEATTNYTIGWNGSDSSIKILPRDFVSDDGGRPLMVDDSGSNRFMKTHSTTLIYATVAIPLGFKATEVTVYGSGTSAMTVYEMNVNAKVPTSKGTGNIGTTIDITDVTASGTNYLLIECDQTSSEEVYGGLVEIEPVYG